MTGFVSGADRAQGTMFPAQLEDYVAEDNPVRVIDFFVDQLDLGQLGFWRIHAKLTGRPAYDPAVMLKLYVYGYLNRVQSSRRLERECQRNVEVMWLAGCLAPDHRRFPQGQRPGHPQSMPRVHFGMRTRGLAHRHGCCHRREQVQGGQLA